MNIEMLKHKSSAIILLLWSFFSYAVDYSALGPCELYNKGIINLHKKKYQEASDYFANVFFYHPTHKIAEYAEVMEMYSLFLNTSYDQIPDLADNFIILHPISRHISYVLYLKSVSLFVQSSDFAHDPNPNINTYNNMKDFLAKFPHSIYSQSISKYTNVIYNAFAQRDLYIAKQYLDRNNPVAAIPRLLFGVKLYDKSAFIDEIIAHLIDAYIMLGLDQEAYNYAYLLAYNHPKSPWYLHAYKAIKHMKSIKKL